MRTVTVTEKYRAVQEGRMAKSVFLQHMKREYPFYISQFDSFDSSVSILKNKGMLFEAKENDVYADSNKFSDEGLRRGTDAELEKMGIDSAGVVKEEELEKAKNIALKNLKKDPLHYLNLLSGDSKKVDKHDNYVEYKNGNDKDVYTGMKKAELKEEVSEADAIPTEPGIPGERASNHNRKMALRKIIDFLTKDGHPKTGFKVSNDDALSFIKTHRDDIFNGDINANDISNVWDEYDEFETINRDSMEEGGNIEHNCANHVMHEKYGAGICLEGKHTLLEDGTVTHYDVFFKEGSQTVENIPVNELNILTSSHHGHKRNKKKNEEVEEQMTDQQMKDIQNYGKADTIVKPFKPGDMWSNDFDYEGMLEAGLKVRLNTPLETMQALYSSFEDVNYHSENQHLGRAIDAKKEGDKSEALDHLRNFRKAVKETLLSLNEGGDPLRDVDELMGYNRRGEKEEEPRPSNYTKVNEEDFDSVDSLAAFSDTIQVVGYPKTVEDALKVIERYERDRDPVSREEAKDLVAGMRATDEDDFDRNITNLIVKAFNIKLKGVSEKKGKDHDGDGDIDGDDYMAAKDKAIKKAMGKDEIVRENIKSIITKVLEEQTINEAATNQLSKLADDYGDFKGMQIIINDLENIVTDVESYYAKIKDRLQGVMDKVGEVSNPEGLKVGAFLAPAIEAAFRKDLRPVTSKGFTKDLNIPKVQRISQADIDRGYVDESEPKQTVYSPVNEKKK